MLKPLEKIRIFPLAFVNNLKLLICVMLLFVGPQQSDCKYLHSILISKHPSNSRVNELIK